ncbi:MAG: hypothetical protein RSD35_08780, partial [Oscillospiraceae bacterium]
MEKMFPRTMVGGVSLPRMIIGCNWISGFSHRGSASDVMIKTHHRDAQSTSQIFEKFLEKDINCVLGLFNVDPNLKKAVKLAQDKTGKKMIIIDEPIINVDDTAIARHEAELEIKKCAQHGASCCL